MPVARSPPARWRRRQQWAAAKQPRQLPPQLRLPQTKPVVAATAADAAAAAAAAALVVIGPDCPPAPETLRRGSLRVGRRYLALPGSSWRRSLTRSRPVQVQSKRPAPIICCRGGAHCVGSLNLSKFVAPGWALDAGPRLRRLQGGARRAATASFGVAALPRQHEPRATPPPSLYD